MKTSRWISVLLLCGLLATACSKGTKTESSWSNQAFDKPVKNIYLIGVARTEFNRNYFENTLHGKLKDMGVNSIPSSTDLPKIPRDPETSKGIIIKKLKENGCDSVLVAKVTGQNTKATFSSGRSNYSFVGGRGRNFGGVQNYGQRGDFRDWATFYTAGYQAVQTLPTATSVVILTIEAALYDLQSEELIWTALFETGREANFEVMVKKFVDEMTSDLKKNGNI